MNKKPPVPVKDESASTKNDCKLDPCINIDKLTPEELKNMNFASWGAPEETSAALYAMNRISKDKCTDPTLLAKYATRLPDNPTSCDESHTCPEGHVCKEGLCYTSPFKWVETPTSTMWRCPDAIKDSCEAGVCRIVDENFCLSSSQLPWTPIYKSGQSPTFNSLPQNVPCETNKDCKNIAGYSKGLGECVTTAKGQKMCSPVMPYLEWHPSLPWTEHDVCGPAGNAGINKKTKKDSNCGRCVFGNHSLRKFCEFPITRRKEPTHGATDVPPFCYNKSDGSCRMTPSYCKWEGIKYTDNGSDGSNKDVESGQFACDRKDAKCYVPKGQQMGEFFIGKTLFRDKQKLVEGLIATAGILSGGPAGYALAAGADYGIEKTGFLKNDRSRYFSPAYDKNYFKEDFEHLPVISTEEAKETISKNYVDNLINQVKKGFQKSPNTIKKLIDDKYIKTKKIISKNIAGEGINIYAIEWIDSLNDNSSMGFIASELKTKYPHLIKEIDGKQHLIMNKKDITNKDLKRLYFFANNTKWLTTTMIELYASNYNN